MKIVSFMESAMPQPGNPPQQRHGIPAEQRIDEKKKMHPDPNGLEDQNVTRPAPIDVERQDRSDAAD